jgi:GxxExxY protein
VDVKPRIDADETRISGSVRDLGDELLHRELTQTIIGAAFAVHAELGSGFLEKVYETALLVELMERGLAARAQMEIPVFYKTKRVGVYVADLLVNEIIICEIKAVRAIAPEHHAQLLNYLKATGLEVGLVLNFGGPSLTFKRLVRSK